MSKKDKDFGGTLSCSFCGKSQKEVKKLIQQGCVTIGSVPIRKPETKVDTEQDEIYLNGKKIGYSDYEYYMLNKPARVISATECAHTQTVVDLIETKQ